MAAITDLTCQQWQAQLPAGSLTVVSGKVMMDLGVVSGLTIDALTDPGVIKVLTVLLNAGLAAQTSVNTGQVAGERLAAFGVPTSGSIVNGYAPTTRPFTSRSEVATATNVVGQIA